ncbi:hypothetical protein KVT40_001727 [Elsinoe batatas]|uniref:Calcineurin-like phosphoesterase domain-containing protein n=1 Tax=Elsinoe batatas TaxID=2601811 RepID=A0A8K0L8K3_9PEZI|nr:hypothetical protein KVT40_001727 [Elsinoe batatas]
MTCTNHSYHEICMANTITRSPPTLRKTRIVCVSDTHGASPKDGAFKLPRGDVLIHAGDLTNQGGHAEMKKTIDWIASSDYEVKIVVAGNHDLTLSPPSPTSTLPILNHPSILYLTHQPSLIRLSSPTGPHTSFRLFASPYSPLLSETYGAFTYTPPQADEIWSSIPLDTDVVVTHTPMRGHLDLHPRKGRVGCEALRRRMGEVRPALVVHGHVHEGRGGEVIRWKDCIGGQERGQGEGGGIVGGVVGGFVGMEEGTTHWEDPAVVRGGRGESRLDLTGRWGRGRGRGGMWDGEGGKGRGRALENDFSSVRGAVPVRTNTGRRGRGRSGAREKGWVGEVNRAGQRKGEVENHVSFSVEGDGEETRRSRLHHVTLEAWTGREGRRETCVVNAAIMARSHGMGAKRYNQPIVVEIDLPVWEEGEDGEGFKDNEVKLDERDGGEAGGKDIMDVDVE